MKSAYNKIIGKLNGKEHIDIRRWYRSNWWGKA